MSAPETLPPSVIRRRGLLHLVGGLATFGLGLTVPLFLLPYLHHQLTPWGMIPFALPGAYALVGALELITGVPFQAFAKRWDELKGWQRGVIGTAIVLIAFAAMIGVIALVLVEH